MYKLRIGRSVAFNENFSSSLKASENAGLQSFDFDLCSYGYNEKNALALLAAIDGGIEEIKKTPLYFNGVHIPFGDFWDYSALDEGVRKNAVEYTKKIFEKINPLNPHCYILHGSFEPIADCDRSAKLTQLKKSLLELLPHTSALICVEDLPRTCLLNTSGETLALLNECKGVCICLDSNHFLHETPENAVLALGGAIKTTHISDYDFVDERHWLPKKGKINWNAFIGALESTGYNGVFNYEVGTASAEQIKQNATEIFADYNAQKGE